VTASPRGARRWPLPLRRTIPALILAFGLVVVGADLALNIRQSWRHVEGEMEQHARVIGTLRSADIETSLRRGTPERAAADVANLSVDRNLRVGLVADAAGRVLWSTRFELTGRSVAETEAAAHVPALRAAARRGQASVVLSDDRRLLLAGFPVLLAPTAAERVREPLRREGTLLLVYDLAWLKRHGMEDALRQSAITALLLGTLCFLAWLVLRRAVTLRADRLVAATERFGEGDFEASARLRGSDELARLSRAFDEMAGTIATTHTVLSESEERLRLLISHSSDVIAVVGEDGVLRWVGESAERILGAGGNRHVGRRALDLVHPADHPRLQGLLARARAEPGGTWPLEARLRHADGQWREFEVTVVSLLHEPTVAGILVTARDVTDRRRLEDQLRQAQKMEAMGRLAGGVAHDFNNLLTVIRSSAELLGVDLAADDPRHEEVTEIAAAAERAAGLTRQLLAFSRRQPVAPRVVPLNDVARGAERLLERLLGEDVRLVTVLDAAEPAVLADPGQLEQVLLNLALNARDAMPQGGSMVIETSVVRLDAAYAELVPGAGAGPHAALKVSDTGIGMSREVQARVFEPFFTTKPPGQGTGLGLATVYGIVQQAGGHVVVYSEPGLGSTFKVLLPLATVAEDGEAEARPPRRTPVGLAAMQRGSETILLAEDEPSLRRLARRALEGLGYRVLEAADGAAALEAARAYEGRIDLLLSDVVMPNLGGRETAETLLRERPGLRVLFMSGYTADVMLRHLVAEEGAPFLEKPFTVELLARKVREALDTAAVRS